jgi:putative peptidoglycan lipid II flippase
MRKKGGAFKTVTIMMIITLAGKVLGLLRDSLVGSYYGTGSIEGTAFNYASVLPRQFMDVMFASAISASFIPVFNETLERRGKDDAFKLAHNFISVILTISVAFTLLCILFSNQIIGLYDGGKNPEAINLASSLIKAMFVIIILSCLAFSLTGVLQSLGEFNIPAAMGLASNGVILIYFIFFMKTSGVFGLCAAYVLGWLAQFVIQIPFLIKSKFKYRFKINFKDENLRRIGMLMLPVMVSTWVTPVNILVNGKAALMDSWGMQSYNAITYANTLYSVISGVFVLSVSNVIFPQLSVLAAHENVKGFADTMSKTIHSMLFLLIPMSMGLIALSQPIVRLVYQRGQFTTLSTDLTSQAMIYFSLGICGFGLQTILTRGFYAIQEGTTPMITSIAAIAINLALSFGLVKTMGVSGPAAASSISITIAALIMLVIINKKYRGTVNKTLAVDLIKMLAIGCIMLICVILARNYLQTLGRSTLITILSIAIPIILGCGVYFVLALTLRLPETTMAIDMICGMGRKLLTKTKR